MRKLSVPAYDPIEVYGLCVSEVADDPMKAAYLANTQGMTEAVADFEDATEAVAWSALPRANWGHPEQLILGALSKGALMDLYTKYMVGASGTSRLIYDEIFVAAAGKCPFCGGLGQPSTLDHYLPKAIFPKYAILPANLVPCCRDCNVGEQANFSALEEAQTIHPYLDADRFFNERWLRADIQIAEPILPTYRCAPPGRWSPKDRSRVAEHFRSYKYSRRFGVMAGAEAARQLNLRRGSLQHLSTDDYRSYLLECANDAGFDLNGWSRTMFQALADTAWFCETDFTVPNWAAHVVG